MPRDVSWSAMGASGVESLVDPQLRGRYGHLTPPLPTSMPNSRRSSSGGSKYSSSPLHTGLGVGSALATGGPGSVPGAGGMSSSSNPSSGSLYGFYDPGSAAAAAYERGGSGGPRTHWNRQHDSIDYLQPAYGRPNIGTYPPPGRQRTMPTTLGPSPMMAGPMVGGTMGSSLGPGLGRASTGARRTPTELARRETDSPTSKDRFKDLTRVLREREKESFAAAVEYFETNLHTLPERSHYRAYLEMADIAKRDNNIETARAYFQRASVASPTAPQVWLEWAKLEEECGELLLCQSILKRGLHECPLVEALLIKGVKHEERLLSLSGARAMLSRLLVSEPDKAWRMLSEGAMLEARAGRTGVARQVFRFLMQAVPSHGPIFYDAVQLEERCGSYESALRIAERGLALVPRYGPLWFKVLRLLEKLKQPLAHLRSTASEALHNVSRELLWKICYEQAQFEARAGLMGDARQSYAHAVRFCPKNLRWKIWLGSARTELGDGHMITARALLGRAALEVPRKTRAIVLLERSRLEEYDGRLDTAREILAQGCNEARFEWKIFLEAVLVEYRAGRVLAAVEQGRRALECHPGTGRLWAVLIQLHQVEGEEAQLAMFRRALQQVPKSGEVWCEGARLRLNPLSSQFDLVVARRCLDFAIQFTPQYGDSFVEYLRLELLQAGSTRALEDLLRSSVNADPNYGALWCTCRQDYLDDADQVLHAALELIQQELYATRMLYAHALVQGIRRSPPLCLPQEVVAEPMVQLWRRPGATCVLCQTRLDTLPVVTLACSHSFHEGCAKMWSLPQSPVCGFAHAEKACPLCSEPWCVVRYFLPSLPTARPREDSAAAAANGLSSLTLRSGPSSRQSSGGSSSPRSSTLMVPLEESDDVGLLLVDLGCDLACVMDRPVMRATPASSSELVPPASPASPAAYTPHDFVTGLVQLNRDYCRAGQLPSALRQKILFGSDFVVP